MPVLAPLEILVGEFGGGHDECQVGRSAEPEGHQKPQFHI